MEPNIKDSLQVPCNMVMENKLAKMEQHTKVNGNKIANMEKEYFLRISKEIVMQFMMEHSIWERNMEEDA